MTTPKSFFLCWVTGDKTDEINDLQTELQDTRTKLEEARKELRKIKFENVSLLNKSTVDNLSLSPSFNAIAGSPHVSRPIPSFDYSSSTMIIHPEYTAKQEKSEEKVMSKLHEKHILQYQPLALSDTEEYTDSPHTAHARDGEYNQYKAKVHELMKQIDRLSKVISKTENDKQSAIHDKDEEIASLRKEVKALKVLNDKISEQVQQPSALTKRVSFSLSLNQDINELVDDDDNISKSYSNRSVSSQSSKYSKRNHYDYAKEQIDILNNVEYKTLSLALCGEAFSINKSGKDKGLVLFFEKYLKTKTLEQIFTKSGMATKTDTDRIANATALVNVLSFVVILYKVKVFQTENPNERPQINNAEIKDSVKYLAIWIVRTYGEKTRNKYYHNKREKEYDMYSFKMSKEEFGRHMPRYLEEFVKRKAKHIDSDLSN